MSPNHDALRSLGNGVSREPARERVTRVLYEVLLEEQLDVGPCALLLPEEREWVRGAIAVPLQEATEAAVETLSWGVARALERAPGGLLARLEAIQRERDLAWE